jgi:arylsulfatase A-like enzyme
MVEAWSLAPVPVATWKWPLPAAAALALLAAPAAARRAPQDDDEATSSVILIVLDDLGTDQLAFYLPELDPTTPEPACGAVPPPGGRAFPCTPELRRLRDEGILFTQAYANPSCTPTRAAILTGRYGFRTGMGLALDENRDCGLPPLEPCDGPQSLSDAEILLPELVRAASDDPDLEIACAAFGKWHLTYVQGDECHAVRNGFELFQGNMGNAADTQAGPDHFDWIDTVAVEDATTGCTLVSSGRTANVRTCPPAQPQNTWDAAVTRRRARRWIEQQIALRKPFLAYVAFNPPHAAYQVPPLCDLSQETQDERRVAIYNAMV